MMRMKARVRRRYFHVLLFLLLFLMTIGGPVNAVTPPDGPAGPTEPAGPSLPDTPRLPDKPAVPDAPRDVEIQIPETPDTRGSDIETTDTQHDVPSTDTASSDTVGVDSGVDTASDSEETSAATDSDTGENIDTEPVEEMAAAAAEEEVVTGETVAGNVPASESDGIVSVAIGLFGAALLIAILVVATRRKKNDR